MIHDNIIKSEKSVEDLAPKSYIEFLDDLQGLDGWRSKLGAVAQMNVTEQPISI